MTVQTPESLQRKEDGQPKVLYVYSLVPLKDNPYKACNSVHRFMHEVGRALLEVSDLVYSDYPNKRVRREMHGIYVCLSWRIKVSLSSAVHRMLEGCDSRGTQSELQCSCFAVTVVIFSFSNWEVLLKSRFLPRRFLRLLARAQSAGLRGPGRAGGLRPADAARNGDHQPHAPGPGSDCGEVHRHAAALPGFSLLFSSFRILSGVGEVAPVDEVLPDAEEVLQGPLHRGCGVGRRPGRLVPGDADPRGGLNENLLVPLALQSSAP